MEGHRIRWFARVPPSEEFPDGYLPRGPYMRGKDWGWDARCSCGWCSATGGAIQQRIREAIEEHKWQVQFEATHEWNGRDWVEVAP